MPVYEYKCKVCDEHFEIEQSFTDDTLTSLDGCDVDDSGSHQLKKVFRAVGISFKGDGFYRNDSRSSGAKLSSDTSASSTSDDSSSSDSSSGDSSKSDSSDTKSDKASSSDSSSKTKSDGASKSDSKKKSDSSSKTSPAAAK